MKDRAPSSVQGCQAYRARNCSLCRPGSVLRPQLGSRGLRGRRHRPLLRTPRLHNRHRPHIPGIGCPCIVHLEGNPRCLRIQRTCFHGRAVQRHSLHCCHTQHIGRRHRHHQGSESPVRILDTNRLHHSVGHPGSLGQRGIRRIRGMCQAPPAEHSIHLGHSPPGCWVDIDGKGHQARRSKGAKTRRRASRLHNPAPSGSPRIGYHGRQGRQGRVHSQRYRRFDTLYSARWRSRRFVMRRFELPDSGPFQRMSDRVRSVRHRLGTGHPAVGCMRLRQVHRSVERTRLH